METEDIRREAIVGKERQKVIQDNVEFIKKNF